MIKAMTSAQNRPYHHCPRDIAPLNHYRIPLDFDGKYPPSCFKMSSVVLSCAANENEIPLFSCHLEKSSPIELCLPVV